MTEHGEGLSVGRVTGAVYVSPHPSADLDPKPALLALINGAKQSIHFAIYSLTLDAVRDALIAAHQRGVTIRGIADATTVSGPTNDVAALAQAGIDVRVWGSHYHLMHDKVIVVDGSKVGLGSYNWTTQAESSNVEVFFVCSGANVAKVLAPTLVTQIENAYAQGGPVP